jgi:hypothetical protein
MFSTDNKLRMGLIEKSKAGRAFTGDRFTMCDFFFFFYVDVWCIEEEGRICYVCEFEFDKQRIYN